jgi:electron transfer flavoprotein alpha/beta subunit
MGEGLHFPLVTGTPLVTAAILLEDLHDGKAVATRTLGKGQRQKVTFPFPALVMCDRTMDIEDHSSIPNLVQASIIKIKELENKTQTKSERKTQLTVNEL